MTAEQSSDQQAAWSDSNEPEQILTEAGVCPDEDVDLALTALALAALDRPRVSLDRYRRHLQELADDIARRAGGAVSAEDRAAVLGEVLGNDYGYEGDLATYDDLQNANLMRVIDRRRGLPVALGILYIHGARAQGWPMVGINFPGHFLLRMECKGERVILDPFEPGRRLEANDLRELFKRLAGEDAELETRFFDAVGNREILLRLQNNIKSRALRSGDVVRAAAALKSMIRIAPDHVNAWYELGLLEAQADNLRAAITALETFLSKSAHDAARHHAATLIQELHAKLN